MQNYHSIGCCTYPIRGTYVGAVVLTLARDRYNAVRGHTTGSNNYGAENYLRRKEVYM